MRKKSTRLGIDIWQEGKTIHITGRQKRFHTYVRDGKGRGSHPQLFSHLKKILKRCGFWQDQKVEGKQRA